MSRDICLRCPDTNKAEGVGFEPTSRLATANGFRDRPVQPLRHPSRIQRRRFYGCSETRAGRCFPGLQGCLKCVDQGSVQDHRQTQIGRVFDTHPLLLRVVALLALIWGIAYLGWRIGWSGQGASPIAFTMLLVTELYGFLALATMTWFSWSKRAVRRPPVTAGRRIDVYVCTYDEPVEVVLATLAGCRALTYPHTTWLLDDGRRPEMRELAELAGARYLSRRDNSHAKAGNINAALTRTDGELVLMLDADHVPMPDALDAMVGFFDDEQIGLVQSPHDFFNHDSVQHYVVGRHEQSLFYRVVCPGKDRNGAAYWCGSAALIRARRCWRSVASPPRRSPRTSTPRSAFNAMDGRPATTTRSCPGPRPARSRWLPPATRPLGARQSRGIRAARVTASRP